MAQIDICFPGRETEIHPGTIWFASITTRKRFAVEGEILGTQYQGKLLRRERISGKYRTILAFPPMKEGDYTLMVKPCKPGPRPATCVVRVKGENHLDLTISSHNNNDNISSQLDGFVAFGTLGDESIRTVTMTSNEDGATPIPAGTPINEDWDNDTWTAMFPTLPVLGGTFTYTLRVEDWGASTTSRTGLNPRAT